MDGDAIAIGRFQHSRQCPRSFSAGDFDAVLRAIGEALP